MQARNVGLLWRLEVRMQAGWFALMIMLALLGGCATAVKVAPQPEQPVAPVINQGPSVTRLGDGRQGFVIRETSSMDAGTRDAFERAVALMNDGKNDKAIELLAKVIERSPGVTAPYIDIAIASLRVGNPEMAEQHLKTALEMVPHHPVASNEYGLLLRKAGRFHEAREVYEKALADFPDYLPIHRNLGILCDLYLNDPECALKQFEIYREGMPQDEQVKIWIAELRIRLGRAENPKQGVKPAGAEEAPTTAPPEQEPGQPNADDEADAGKAAEDAPDNGDR